MSNGEADIHAILASINGAWREGRPLSMLEYLHPGITMALPGFKGSIQGRDVFIASFEEFCRNARVIKYEESDEHIDVVGDCAVATFCFKMLYERAAYREESKGRDIWVFQRQDDRWFAVWRTMVEVTGERSPRNDSA